MERRKQILQLAGRGPLAGYPQHKYSILDLFVILMFVLTPCFAMLVLQANAHVSCPKLCVVSAWELCDSSLHMAAAD